MSDFDHFLTTFQLKNMINDYNLLVEIKEYLQQKEKKWSIGKNHIRVLCKHGILQLVIKKEKHLIEINFEIKSILIFYMRCKVRKKFQF